MSQNHGRDAPAINSTKKSSLFEVPSGLSVGQEEDTATIHYRAVVAINYKTVAAILLIF
jgi:hypothetical protein